MWLSDKCTPKIMKDNDEPVATTEEVIPTQEEVEEEREVAPRERPDTEITLNDGRIHITSKDIVRNEEKPEEEVPWVYDEPVIADTWMTIQDDQEFYNEHTIGAVSIPSLDIKLAVLRGVNDDIMHAGAGLLSPYQVMGQNNYPLISHKLYLYLDQNLLFNNIEYIEMGAIIRLTDLETIYEYKAYDFVKIDETEADAVDPFKTSPDGNPIISLITCVSLDDLESRYVVYGELVGTKPYTEEAFTALED